MINIKGQNYSNKKSATCQSQQGAEKK
jgi:hypothetical protein